MRTFIFTSGLLCYFLYLWYIYLLAHLDVFVENEFHLIFWLHCKIKSIFACDIDKNDDFMGSLLYLFDGDLNLNNNFMQSLSEF